MSISLTQPTDGDVNWGVAVTANFSTIQNRLNDSVTGSSSLGSDTTINSTSNTTLASVSFTPNANGTAVIFANLVLLGGGASSLADFQIVDENSTIIAQGWKNLATAQNDQTTIMAAQAVTAGVQKTWSLQAKVNSAGQSFTAKQSVGPTFIGYVGNA